MSKRCTLPTWLNGNAPRYFSLTPASSAWQLDGLLGRVCEEADVHGSSLPVAEKGGKKNKKLQAWIDARKRHRLSHAQVQMAREPGMNPRTLGKLDHHGREPWKMPLWQYIEHLYAKRCPQVVLSIEEIVGLWERKKALGGRKSPERGRPRLPNKHYWRRFSHERVSVLRVPSRG